MTGLDITFRADEHKRTIATIAAVKPGSLAATTRGTVTGKKARPCPGLARLDEIVAVNGTHVANLSPDQVCRI